MSLVSDGKLVPVMRTTEGDGTISKEPGAIWLLLAAGGTIRLDRGRVSDHNEALSPILREHRQLWIEQIERVAQRTKPAWISAYPFTPRACLKAE